MHVPLSMDAMKLVPLCRKNRTYCCCAFKATYQESNFSKPKKKKQREKKTKAKQLQQQRTHIHCSIKERNEEACGAGSGKYGRYGGRAFSLCKTVETEERATVQENPWHFTQIGAGLRDSSPQPVADCGRVGARYGGLSCQLQ